MKFAQIIGIIIISIIISIWLNWGKRFGGHAACNRFPRSRVLADFCTYSNNTSKIPFMPQDLPHQTAFFFELSSPSPPALANFPLEEEEKVVANHGTPCTSGSTSSCHIEDRGTTWLQEICRTRTSQILYQETVDIRYFRFTLLDTLMCFLRTPNFVHE